MLASRTFGLLFALSALGFAACSGGESGDAGRAAMSSPGGATAPPASSTSAPAPESALEAVPGERRLTIAFLGDSLTAGLGVDADQAYPALVAAKLAERGLPVRTINAGVSGDTTAGGLARVDWLLAQRPAILFVCLGGNDGLRGLPLEATEANLRAIVERARGAGARVVLAGMQIPPNYGPEYASGFRGIFPRIARELEVPLLPFLLEGVAADPALNQPDGIHPNADGQKIVADTVTRALEPVVRELASRAG